MILGFKETFPWGKPTYFREKILCGVGYAMAEEEGKYWRYKPSPYNLEIIKKIGNINPKIHTIRSDMHNKWKEGRSIQMVYRGANYSIKDHFNKDLAELDKCIGVQTISIKWFNIHTKHLPILNGEQISKLDSWNHTRQIQITIDGCNINYDRLQILARNDGFDSSEDFIQWFNQDFEGKIIHWTNFKY